MCKWKSKIDFKNLKNHEEGDKRMVTLLREDWWDAVERGLNARKPLIAYVDSTFYSLWTALTPTGQ